MGKSSPREAHSCEDSTTCTSQELFGEGLMGESSPWEAHSCEDSTTCTSQKLFGEGLKSFNCSICLELVYKPIVQACGHIFCFWCAFQAMNVRKESHCPVCRRPYKYFPRVCELLHFALSKAIPEEYERRGRDVQYAEEQKQIFSPRLLESPRQAWSPRTMDEVASLNSLRSTPRGGVTLNVNASAGNITRESGTCSQTRDGHEVLECAHRDTVFMQKGLTEDDFCCSRCNDLLYNPVVLNCGKVFCEPCLKNTSSEGIYCLSCKSPHPGNFIFVCLELHQYLESAFPAEYSRRKLQQPAVTTKHLTSENGQAGDCKTGRVPHVGVGCDGCGMYPIEGVRYRCVECTEKVGFDLCESCYENPDNVWGRFNQQHQPNHHMEQIQPRVQRRFFNFNMHNSSIQRRRQQQQAVNDLDDYINCFIE